MPPTLARILSPPARETVDHYTASDRTAPGLKVRGPVIRRHFEQRSVSKPSRKALPQFSIAARGFTEASSRNRRVRATAPVSNAHDPIRRQWLQWRRQEVRVFRGIDIVGDHGPDRSAELPTSRSVRSCRDERMGRATPTLESRTRLMNSYLPQAVYKQRTMTTAAECRPRKAGWKPWCFTLSRILHLQSGSKTILLYDAVHGSRQLLAKAAWGSPATQVLRRPGCHGGGLYLRQSSATSQRC